ncbi:MAG: hypothetical protein WBA42_21360 [Mesorhizobium sp.]
MANLIGKRGLKAEQKDEIKAVLEKVNGRANRWTAGYGDVVAMLKAADAQLDNAGLPESYRAGATAECFTSAPSTGSYGYAVKGNRVVLRRFSKEWRVVEVESFGLYPKDSRANKVKVSLSADQIERIKAAAIAPIDIQTAPQPKAEQAFDDCYLVVDGEGHIQQAA